MLKIAEVLLSPKYSLTVTICQVYQFPDFQIICRLKHIKILWPKVKEHVLCNACRLNYRSVVSVRYPY
jgi:hypothetical protein